MSGGASAAPRRYDELASERKPTRARRVTTASSRRLRPDAARVERPKLPHVEDEDAIGDRRVCGEEPADVFLGGSREDQEAAVRVASAEQNPALLAKALEI